MEKIALLAKIVDICKKMGWDSPYTILRTLIVVIFSILIGAKINQNTPKADTSVGDIYMDELTISDIKEELNLLGDSAFITRIRYEQSASGDADIFCFKDAYGIIGGHIINLKEYNPIYKSIYKVDENSKEYIRNMKSLESTIITARNAKDKGYTAINRIMERQNLPIDRFRLIAVKDEFGIVWIFTLSFANNNKITDDYSSKFYNYGYDRLYKLAASEQQKINLRNKSILNTIINSYK